ncbi:hypothetical protein HanIR_Chr06g0260011 [Helianthus annuus]|nr:hypothetical protein HanIR_Chr06g0260011 [Helianthus annuus]
MSFWGNIFGSDSANESQQESHQNNQKNNQGSFDLNVLFDLNLASDASQDPWGLDTFKVIMLVIIHCRPLVFNPLLLVVDRCPVVFNLLPVVVDRLRVQTVTRNLVSLKPIRYNIYLYVYLLYV